MSQHGAITSSEHAGEPLPVVLAPAARARAVVLLRQHWLAAALLTVGLALRVLASLTYRPALFYIDSVRYLYNADGMDPVGYKGPLRAILAIGNFDAVAIVQHLLGLAIAVLIYVLLLRRGVSRWLAALAMAPILLDGYQLQTEQSIMPGTWFEALIVAGLAVLLWQQAPGWRRVVLAGLLLGTSATVAQVGEAMILPAAIYLLAVGGGWRRATGKAAVLVLACAVPILAYCTISYEVSGAFYLSHTGVTSFYGRTAAAADCATLKLPKDERGMCPSKAQQAQGPDWLEYNNGSPIRPYYNHLPRGEVDAMISNFSHRVLAQQPGRVLRAYGRDLLKLFALTRHTSPGDTPISRWQFQLQYPYFPPWTSRQVVHTAIGEYGGGAPKVWLPGARFLRSYQLDGGYTPGPLFAVCLLAGLAGSAALLWRRIDPGVRQQALGSFLFLLSAVSVLMVSDTFEFSWRYQLPALVTLVPAGALGVTVLARLIAGRRAGRAGAAEQAQQTA